MTQLGNAAIGTLVPPIVAAFTEEPDPFWRACAAQAPDIRAEIAVGPFRMEVEAALTFLDQNATAAQMLGALLLTRPADGDLRTAIGAVHPPALEAVPQSRFELEQLIVASLTSAQAQTLRANLDQIDKLIPAANSYKAMHDALHLLQPLSPLMRRAAAERTRWPDLRSYGDIFNAQLREIDKAIAALAAAGTIRMFGFHDTIRQSLEMMRTALTDQHEMDVSDACSELVFGVEEGLNSVDLLMLNVAQDASAPLALALSFFTALSDSAGGTQFHDAIRDYVAFADDTSKQLLEAISEHGSWQKLDRNFDLLQRAVIENQPSAPGEIDTIWRLTIRGLEQLCGATQAQDAALARVWAAPIVQLLELTRVDLMPPISPPVSDIARDRVSDLISSARNRFMEVDRSLLDQLSQSAHRRPQLMALLRGEVSDAG